HVRLELALPGQQDYRPAAAALLRLAQQRQPVALAQLEVNQVNVVLVRADQVQRLVVVTHPLQMVAALWDLAQVVAREDEIFLIVVHQQHADRVVRGARAHRRVTPRSVASTYPASPPRPPGYCR